VASALAHEAPDAAILLATGAEEVVRYGLPNQVEILKLPGLHKDGNQSYSSRRLRLSVGEIRDLRSALLLTAVKAFRPDVVLVDKHPFGASGEFKAGLKALKRTGGRAVLGLRDILDEPAQVLREWKPNKMLKRVAEFHDQVLIYGDRTIFDPITAYAFPPDLAERTSFCGYVFTPESAQALENFEWPFPPRARRPRPVVLATVGGGEDGFQTLTTFLQAAAKAPWQGIAVAGPMTPEREWEKLTELAAVGGVTLRQFVPHLSALFQEVDALVCMGGYNTLVEATAVGVPTVCVPRVTPRTEQLIRAEAFERLGLVQLCHPARLSPENLREQIAVALGTAPMELRARAQATLRFHGAQQAAQTLLRLASPPSSHTAPTESQPTVTV